MLLVEIALQNAKAFEGKVRLAFKPGLNVVPLQDPERRAAVLDCIYFPLFPDPSRATATDHLVSDTSQPARVALSFYGRDKLAYRVIRDLGTGATRLYRFEAESKKYALLTEVTTEAAQYVRVQQRLPDEVSYERLFTISNDTMPSRGARARTRSGTPVIAESAFGGPMGDPFAPRPDSGGWGASPPRAMSGPPGSGPGAFGSPVNMMNALVQAEMDGEAPEPETVQKDDLLKELERMEQHLQASRQAALVERELDKLNRRKAALASQVESLEEKRSAAQAAQRDLDGMADLADLPPNFKERIENFEAATARYQADTRRLEEETSRTTDDVLGQRIQPLQRDPYFLGGLGVGIAAILAAYAVGAGWIALFNLVGAAVAGAAAFRYVGELEGSKRLGTRLQKADERRARIERQYDLETAIVRRLMEKLEVNDPTDLLVRLDAYEAAQRRLEEASHQVEDAERNPALRSAAEEFAQVEERIRVLEPKLLGSDGSLMSEGQLEKRIASIRAQLESMGVPIPERSTQRTPSGVKIVAGTADIDEDDDDTGYGEGYGTGSSGSTDPGSWNTTGYFASGFGPGSMGFGGASGYGGGGYDPGGGPPDRSRELIQAGADLVQMDVEGLVTEFKPRFLQYLGAFSDGRLKDGTFGPRGELTVTTVDGDPRPYAQLKGEGLDLVDLALRFALVEMVVANTRIPLLVDDPGGDFPERRRKLFVQMLQYLSKMTQVVVLTEKSDIPGHSVVAEPVG